MISMMGTIGAYTKNLKLQTKFQMKQARGELGSHKSLTEYLSASLNREEDEEQEDKVKNKLREIHNKLWQGGRLTAEEKKYLEANDPEAYQKLKATEQEQKAFEQKLKQCRTKEEAQRLKMTYINSSLMAVRSVEHNSAIPKEKKLEIFMQEKQRCDRIDESSREFVRRGDYEKLPTQAEEAKAVKDEAEAEERERPRAPERKEQYETTQEHRERVEMAREDRRPAIHVESREEKKVKRARANARRGSDAEFRQAVAAYQASGVAEAAAKVDAKG